MFRGYRVARVFFVLPLVLAGCASARPLVLSGDHPANPAASEAPAPRFTTLQAYRAPEQFASQAQPGAAAQPMPGMDHGSMSHGSGPAGGGSPSSAYDHGQGTGAHDHGAGDQHGGGGQSPDGAVPAPRPSPGSHDDSHGSHDGGQGSHHGGPSTAAGEPGRAQDVSRTVRLEARDIAFDIPTLTVGPGETIRFVVTNVGRIPHEFAIGTREELAAHRKMMAGMPNMVHDDPNVVTLKPGETKELIWRFAARADIEFACNVPGHTEAGMRGDVKLVGMTAESVTAPATSVSR